MQLYFAANLLYVIKKIVIKISCCHLSDGDNTIFCFALNYAYDQIMIHVKYLCKATALKSDSIHP